MDRVCFYIGSKPIYWYGVWVAVGLGAAWAHLRRLGRRAGFDEPLVSNMVLVAMLGGLVGARVAYVAANWSQFAGQWLEIIRIDHGGLIFYGGAFGAAAALSVHATLQRIPWRRYADFIVTALPLGHAFGRVGCFLNGCCYGQALTGACDLVRGAARRASCGCYGQALTCACDWLGGRWPVQLMEAAANLVIYAALTRMYIRGCTPGMVFAGYLISYPFVRFMLEFIRGDQRAVWAGLHVAQWLSLALFAAGALLAWIWGTQRRTPAA